MRKLWGLAFVACVSSSFIVGCGESATTTTVEFKPTDTSQFDQMKDQMIKSQMKKGMKRVTPPK